MKVPALRIVSVVGLIISACVSTGLSGSASDPELQEIVGYRQWHKLTEKPIVVEWSVPSG
jgi:hypothetical protein